MDLPTLDFSLFLQGNDREKRALSERLVDSFKKHGFVKLKNHGLPEATVKQFLSAVCKLPFFILCRANTEGR